MLDRALNFCQDHSQEVSEKGVPQGLMFGLVVVHGLQKRGAT